MEIRLLLDHRDDLVAERTRTVNRLRWHLLELCPELERSLKRGSLNQARVLDRVDRRLRKLPAGARVRIARQHRLNRGGDRQLNHALHIIAITRAQHDPTTKEYLARKEAEGKTTKGALRSLKRYLARRFYHLLAEPPADQPQATHGKPITEPKLAAIPERLRPQRDLEQTTTAPNPIVRINPTAPTKDPQRRSPTRWRPR